MSKWYRTTRLRIPSPDGTMRLLLLRPTLNKKPPRETPGILWIHGGGYTTGMPEMVYISRALPLVKKYGAVVISPAYRLSHKAPYPAALEDCYAALLYLKDNAATLGINPDQIMVGGESAGGGLTAALCMLARDQGEVRVAYQMPLYPMLDDRDTPSSRFNFEPMWNTPQNHRGWRLYLGKLWHTDNVPPYAAPARQTNYAGLPPAYTFVGRGEPFHDETLTFIENLRQAGVEASVDVYPFWYHGFDLVRAWNPRARRAAAVFEEHFRYALAHYFAPQDS